MGQIIASPLRIRTSKNCKLKKYRYVRFWAERGLIHIVKEDGGDYTPCMRSEWVARIVALNEEAKRTKWKDEKRDMLRLVQEMIEVNKEAKEQGDPFDPVVQNAIIRAKHSRILVPGMAYAPTGPVSILRP